LKKKGEITDNNHKYNNELISKLLGIDEKKKNMMINVSSELLENEGIVKLIIDDKLSK